MCMSVCVSIYISVSLAQCIRGYLAAALGAVINRGVLGEYTYVLGVMSGNVIYISNHVLNYLISLISFYLFISIHNIEFPFNFAEVKYLSQ